MTSKEIFEAIDLEKVGPELKTKLLALEKATEGFTNERADARMETSMNAVYNFIKDKKPEALKNVEVKTVTVEETITKTQGGKKVSTKKTIRKKVAGKRKKNTKKTPTPSAKNPMPNVPQIAREIREEGESWSDALSRAKLIYNKKKDDQKVKAKKALDDLRDFMKSDKFLKGWPRTYGKENAGDNDLERDLARPAQAPGRRISKTGRVYYENRDNRSDREANTFPRKIYLKGGGKLPEGTTYYGVNEIEFVELQDGTKVSYGYAGDGSSTMISGIYVTPRASAVKDEFQSEIEFAKGGLNKLDYFYIPRSEIKRVVLTEGFGPTEIDGRKVLNGIWMEKSDRTKQLIKEYNAREIKRRKKVMELGGEVYVQPTIIQNNPDYLVGTTTMYEMFELGGQVVVQPTILQNNPDYITSTATMSDYFEKGGMMAKGGKIDNYRIVPYKRLEIKGGPDLVTPDYSLAFTTKSSLSEANAMAQKYVIENELISATLTKIHSSGNPLKNKKVSYVTKDEILKYADGGSIPEGYHQMPDGSIMADSAHMAKGGYVAVSEKDGYWFIISQPSSKEEAQQMIDLGVPRGEMGKVVTLEEAKAYKKVIGREYLEHGGRLKGRNNETGESFAVVIGSAKQYDEGFGVVIRKSYGARIQSFKFRFDENGNLKEILDYGYSLDGIAPDTKGDSGSGRSIFDSNKSTSIKEMAKLTSPAFAKKLYDFVQEQMSEESGMMAKGGEVSVYNLRKGDKVKTRKGDIETILKKNSNGNYETLENDYTHNPESLEFISRPSRKMAKGGAMEHMVFKGDKVLAIHRNMVIVESDLGSITVLDFRTEPLARRILVEPITGKNTLASAIYFIDDDPSFKTTTMAMGGSLQGHGLEEGDLIIEDLGSSIMVLSEDGKTFYVDLREGERYTEEPLPFEHGGEVKIGDIARLAAKYNKTGQEVAAAISEGADVEVEHTEDRKRAMRIAVDHLDEDFYYYPKLKAAEGQPDFSDFYEKGGQVPEQFLDSNGERKIDAKSIEELTDYVMALPQTKSIYFNESTQEYVPSRRKLHADIINKFKEEVVCITEGQPIAIFMGGSPASGKSSFLRKYSPYLLKEEILKVDADEIRAMLPEYDGYNAAQTHLETKDIVNTLLSNKNIGIPCDFDLIYDGTMNSVKSYIPLMDILRKRGYKIFIVYMDKVPKDVIIKRALERYKKSGRFVPLEVIEDFFEKGKTAFNDLKKEVDGYMVIDGSNQDYEIIEKGGIKLPTNREYSKLGSKIDPKDIPALYKKGGKTKKG
jgi:predicted ABC-type ATPase